MLVTNVSTKTRPDTV